MTLPQMNFGSEIRATTWGLLSVTVSGVSLSTCQKHPGILRVGASETYLGAVEAVLRTNGAGLT